MNLALAHRGGVGLVVGVGPPQHHQAPHLGAQAGEVALGRLDRPLGVLVGGRRGQDEDLLAAAGLEQAAVEGAPLLPLSPSDQRQRTAHWFTIPSGGAPMRP